MTDGLIQCLQDSLNKTVEVSFKDSINKDISGQLIGFDGCNILLNSIKDSKHSNDPILIDLEYVCMLTVHEGDAQSYKKAFENFRLEYAKKQKRLKATEGTETT